MKQIILVEDDDSIRDVFNLALKNYDYKIVELLNGEKIINKEIQIADLFVLDKNISGTDGLEICRLIKNSEEFSNVPVIMLSANPNIVQLAKDAGADGTILKPFSIKDLREKVAKYLTI